MNDRQCVAIIAAIIRETSGGVDYDGAAKEALEYLKAAVKALPIPGETLCS